MAEKSGYPPVGNPPPAGMYQQPPPAYYPAPGAPPPAYNAPPQGTYPQTGGTTVVIQQQAPRQRPPPRQTHGILGFLSKEADAMGRMAGREIDWAAKQVTGSIHQNMASRLLDNFKTNNIVQLVSRASGGELQIVMSPTGQLVVDGVKRQGPDTGNANWTVIQEGNNQIRLHNNNNYLAIVNGNTILTTMPPGTKHGVETLFQLSQSGTQFVSFASKKDTGHRIGILPAGQLKPALATGSGEHSHFGIRLIYSPYQPAGHK